MTKNKEGIERVTLKLPQSVANYFRTAFPHGKRSQFVAEKLLEHKHEQKVKKIELELKKVNSQRK